MSRILNPSNGRWYHELKAVSYYGETEIERWIRQYAKLLFPHHHTIPFKKKVTSTKKSESPKKPDLALIRHDFSAWNIVEVELEEHNLNDVLDQVRVFINGDYNLVETVEYVREQFWKIHQKRVSLAKLKNLFEDNSPSVLVVADNHSEAWKKELKKLGANFCIFEIYKNASGHHLYRIHGEYPAVFVDEAQCRPHKTVSNLIEVIGEFRFIHIDQKKSVDISYDDLLTRWTLIKDSGKQYLKFTGKSNPLSLSPRDTYGLFRDKSNKYYFKRS